jgi:hypothetical protein
MKWVFTLIFLMVLNIGYSQYWSDKGNYKQLIVPGNILTITSNNSKDSIFVSTSACLRIFDEQIDKFIFQYNGIHFLNPDMKGFVDIYEDYGYKVNKYRGFSFIEDSFVVQQYFSYWQEYHGDGSIEYTNIYPILKTSENNIDFIYSSRTNVYQSDYSSNKGTSDNILFSNNDRFRYYSSKSYEIENSSFSEKEIRRESKSIKDNLNDRLFTFYSKFYHFETRINEDDINESDDSGTKMQLVRFVENEYMLLNFEKFIYIFDLHKFRIIDTMKVDFTVSGMGMHKGNIIFTSGESVYYYNVSEQVITKKLETESYLNSSIFLNNENSILLGSLNKLIKFDIADMDSVNITSIISKETDESNGNILIHPNPASDYIKISFGNNSVNKGLQPLVQEDDIEIYVVLGEVVWKSNPSLRLLSGAEVRNDGYFDYAQCPLRIDISHLTKGVYFVRIGARVEKFVKM